MKKFISFVLFLGFLVSRSWDQTVPPELVSYPDMILHNGKIATMDDKSTSSNPGTIAQARSRLLRAGRQSMFTDKTFLARWSVANMPIYWY